MKPSLSSAPLLSALLLALVAAWPGVAAAQSTAQASDHTVVDVGDNIPDPQAIANLMFPPQEDECLKLKAAGFACMGGFDVGLRFSLPANAFKIGSIELPELLKRQLEVFAEVLRGKRGSGKKVRIEGHADASGTATNNLNLSQRRAEAVKAYLVDRGAEADMLVAVGLGDRQPKVKSDPRSGLNRRVEIGRDVEAAGRSAGQ